MRLWNCVATWKCPTPGAERDTCRAESSRNQMCLNLNGCCSDFPFCSNQIDEKEEVSEFSWWMFH